MRVRSLALLLSLVAVPALAEPIVRVGTSQYAVGHELGRGMWQVTHEGHLVDHPEQKVAIKFSKSGTSDFHAESTALTALHGVSNVPAMHGIGTVDGKSALVTELVSGTPLGGKWNHVHELRAPDKAVRMTMQALRGIRAIHAHGISHNDLTPPNMLMDESKGSPSLRIIDFGNSKPLAEVGPQVDLRKAGTLAMLLITGEASDDVSKLPDVTRDVHGNQVHLRDVVGHAFSGTGYPDAQSFIDALRPFEH